MAQCTCRRFAVLYSLAWAITFHGPFPADRAHAQQWLSEANARIEQHRMADLQVAVNDIYGNSVANATVQIEMKRHHFRFGTAVTAGWINGNSQDAQTYRDKLLENFNEVVFENDLKFPPWLGLWGPGFNWPNTEQALDWLDANDLPARGHYLSWATWSGSDAWGDSQDTNTLPQRLFDHITEKAGTVGSRVYEWDVINHPIGWLNDNYENRIGPEFYGDIVDHARNQVPPGTALWINEDDVIAGDSRADDYERVIEKLIADGSPPDGIGFQGHFIEEWGRVSNSTPQQVHDRIDRFSDLTPRLRVTEFDIDVGANEALQGQLMHDYLTAMFSHESIEAITMWGFWGGAHWRGENGALYRSDWSEKPSLTAYQDLVFDEWWTNETGSTDPTGEYLARAFKGYYDITVTHDGNQYEVADFLLDDSAELEIVVQPLQPGDFDADGDVDLSDALLGQRTGQPLDSGSPWNANFGSGATTLSTSRPVPEPAVLLLALSGTCCVVRRTR